LYFAQFSYIFANSGSKQLILVVRCCHSHLGSLNKKDNTGVNVGDNTGLNTADNT